MAKTGCYAPPTGITGAQDDEFGTYDNVGRIDKKWPRDSGGNRLSLGNTVADTMRRLPKGVISTKEGFNDPALDPMVSQAQSQAMHAAAAGRSTLGIPKSVGQEFVKASHGQNVKSLPKKKGQ